MSPSSLSQAAGWSDDRVTRLSKLWGDGLSASQIAKQLGGVTRNAVIGKVHRPGLSGRAAPSALRAIASRPTRSRPPRRAAPSRPARAVRPDMTVAPVAPEGRGLVDNLVHLAAHACKWPIGDPKEPGVQLLRSARRRSLLRGACGPGGASGHGLACRSGPHREARPGRPGVITLSTNGDQR